MRNIFFNIILILIGIDGFSQEILDSIKTKGITCSVNLNPIFYNSNQFSLDSIMKIELNKLVFVMKENPDIIVEIGSHKDCVVSKKINQKLSIKRVDIVLKYVQSKGISKERIFGKRYGELIPIINCDNRSCSKNGHSKNRRTEFRIVSSNNKYMYNSF